MSSFDSTTSQQFYSNRYNPLDKFKSFSYHYQIIASNNTEAIRLIYDLIDSDGSSVVSQINKKRRGEKITLGGGSSVISVINTFLDSEFSINNISYKTVWTGNKTHGNQAITGTMTINVIEPKGIRFLNMMEKISSEDLKTSYSGVVFALITTFVGHTFDGKTEYITMHPIPFMINSIDAAFDESGGTYVMSCMPLTIGGLLQDNGKYSKIRKSFKLFSDKERTLGSVFKSLQEALNKELKDEYDNRNIGNTIKLGRRVYHMFTLPPEWEKFKIDSSFQVENFVEQEFAKQENIIKSEKEKAISEAAKKKIEAQKQQKENKLSDNDIEKLGKVSISTSSKITIPLVINEILNSCTQVLNLSKGNTSNPKNLKDYKTLFMTVNSVTSNDKDLCIHWDIMEYYLPNISKENIVSGEKQQFKNTTDMVNKTYGGNFKIYEYDYLFSGLNKDVLKFDMKMEDALVYIQRNLFAGNNIVGKNRKSKEQTIKLQIDGTETEVVVNEIPDTDSVIPMLENDPVWVSTLPNSFKDKNNAGTHNEQHIESQMNYINSLTRFMSKGKMSANVQIRGNPELLDVTSLKLLKHGTPGELASESQYVKEINKVRDDIKNISKMDSRSDGYVLSIPLFVKFNIYTPSDGADRFRSPEKFWYDDLYNVIGLTHTLSDGTFTQELNLHSYTIYLDEMTGATK